MLNNFGMGANQSKDEVSESSEYKRIQTLIKEKGISAVQEQEKKKLNFVSPEWGGGGGLENHTLSMPFKSTRHFDWYYDE